MATKGEELVKRERRALLERAEAYISDAVCEEDISKRAEGLLYVALSLIREVLGVEESQGE